MHCLQNVVRRDRILLLCSCEETHPSRPLPPSPPHYYKHRGVSSPHLQITITPSRVNAQPQYLFGFFCHTRHVIASSCHAVTHCLCVPLAANFTLIYFKTRVLQLHFLNIMMQKFHSLFILGTYISGFSRTTSTTISVYFNSVIKNSSLGLHFTFYTTVPILSLWYAFFLYYSELVHYSAFFIIYNSFPKNPIIL